MKLLRGHRLAPTVWCGTAMLGSVVGYFFSIITVFVTVMTFMALLIGLFDNSTFEKLRRYQRPIIERTAPAPPNQEPHRPLFALAPNGTGPKDLSADDKNTKDSHADSVAKKEAGSRKPERKTKPERLAPLHQPKALARQQQNYEGYGYAMTLGRSQGYSPGLDSQR